MTAQNMNSQNSATSTDQADRSMTIDTVAANDNAVTNISINDHSDSDNGVDLSAVFEPYFRPDANTIVCGALNEEKVAALAKAGVELVINLQSEDELSFNESAAVERAGMSYEHLPINGAEELKQLKILAFDNILRQYHGKKMAIHCGSGNRVGAAIALRAGWLRGRKMDTAMERGRSHGLTKLEQEVHNRLLVPR
ncbi:sulfur transferase domain-containing protein [Psychrobacter sp. PSP]|jgi:uncharacterized protein (TIGR01244 family)|uniref:TIGR01244 family protein n=3 Tax=Moraxellaceae TaxID=468 RepID=A0A1G6ZAK2_9GAMM|nr:sulfur transferase domain-containing protein [Psychrobacter sp. PSP]AOY42517.1 hypothetical protein AOT82_138 [Psychrobacter sp. AntiMn-1]GLR27897.1 hypothetical protein GCM10007915_01350 [Psychrobacter pacificensis]SDD99047.1 TIGR01244 family protein [Psychrobacter pacificensis]|tara:strand:+ start:8126 stop:8713 length:588 start_codon:yes stop_codon:yes gene_type:complete